MDSPKYLYPLLMPSIVRGTATKDKNIPRNGIKTPITVNTTAKAVKSPASTISTGFLL